VEGHCFTLTGKTNAGQGRSATAPEDFFKADSVETFLYRYQTGHHPMLPVAGATTVTTPPVSTSRPVRLIAAFEFQSHPQAVS
jgi:hypothetical protein